MVKLDLNVVEIVGLAQLQKIDGDKLKKFLQAASKKELEEYILAETLGELEDEDKQEDTDDETEEEPEDDEID